MFSTIKYMTDLPSTNIKKLWESNAKPHLYWFTAKFIKKKGDSKPRFHRPSLCSGPWRREMDLFMDFFRIKTRIEWQDRVLKQHTMPNSIFQYSPPVSRLIARLVVPQAAFHQFQYLANTKNGLTGGKPVGRRLRFCYEYCLEVNAQLRGLPWPPAEEVVEAKDEDTGTEKQSPIIDGCGLDTISIYDMHAESDSKPQSESSVADNEEEDHFLGS